MTDLLAVLPAFQTQQYIHILPSLEKNHVTTADLLTLDSAQVAERAHVPLLEVKKLSNAVLAALQESLGIGQDEDRAQKAALLKTKGGDLSSSWNTISTLDDGLDHALNGGIPTGYITEVTGESGAGKTQFLLTLLLAAQLPAPRGLSGAALYISTESALPTTRLSQLLRTHPVLIAADPKPTLDSVISIVTPDLESQDHILRYQVPVAIRRHKIRLVILDSVAANYRAEFERPGADAASRQTTGANMAQRSSELVKLGQLLRDIARDEKVAIVVANQVADRFSGVGPNNLILNQPMQSSPLARKGSEGLPPGRLVGGPNSRISHGADDEILYPSSTAFTGTTDPMNLDHQQRWFTGWGDDPNPSYLAHKNLKTPSLGLVWTTQIASRIALIKQPVYGPGIMADQENEAGEPVLRSWRRWMKVVFAPHAAPSGPGLKDAVEFAIKGEGLQSVKGKESDPVDPTDVATSPTSG